MARVAQHHGAALAELQQSLAARAARTAPSEHDPRFQLLQRALDYLHERGAWPGCWQDACAQATAPAQSVPAASRLLPPLMPATATQPPPAPQCRHARLPSCLSASHKGSC